MKSLSIVTVLIILNISCFAQGHISSANKSKAAKKAASEAKMYSAKGFKVYHSNLSMENLLKDYYTESYKETAPGERLFISSQGMAKASTSDAALQQAMRQAKQRIPGLLQMYFNSWISVDKRTSEKEKSTLINAVNQSGKALAQMVNTLTPDKTYQLLKTKSGKYQAVVRILFNQNKLRQLARKKIVSTAIAKTGWSKSKIEGYLRF